MCGASPAANEGAADLNRFKSFVVLTAEGSEAVDFLRKYLPASVRKLIIPDLLLMR